MQCDVLIIGAGLAGLTAARQLAAEGLRVIRPRSTRAPRRPEEGAASSHPQK